jgi:hypothetical protein
MTTTKQLYWETEHFMTGQTILDTVLTATGPDDEPLMIGTVYRKGQRFWLLSIGTRNIGDFDRIEAAQQAAEDHYRTV